MGRLLACLALLLTLFSSLSGSLHPAAAQSGGTAVDGHSYTDDVYGFTVTWPKGSVDATLVEDEDGTPYGVNLDTDGVTASVSAAGYDSTEECVTDRVERLSKIDGVENVKKTSSIDDPDFDRDITYEFVRYTYTGSSGKAGTFINYFGCEELLQGGEPTDGVVLTHDYAQSEADFDDGFSGFVDIINDITFSGDDNSNTSDSTPDASSADGKSTPADDDNRGKDGIGDTSYIDPTYGYGVSFPENSDPAVANDDNDNQIGVTFGDGYSAVIQSWEADTAKACVSDILNIYEGADTDSKLEDANDLDAPDSPDAESSALVRIDYTNSSNKDVTLIGYIECRQMEQDGDAVDGVWLAVTLIVIEDAYDDTLPTFNDIISSVTFDAASSQGNNDNGNNNDNGGDIVSGITDDTYGSNTGYTLTWDTDTFDAELAQDGKPDAGVFLSNENAILLTQTVGDPSLSDCVSAELDAVAGLDGMSTLKTESETDSLQGSDDGKSAFKAGTYSLSSGDEPVFVYVECRPLPLTSDGSQFFLCIRVIAFQANYSDLQDPLQNVLDSITVVDATDSSNADDTGNADATDTADSDSGNANDSREDGDLSSAGSTTNQDDSNNSTGDDSSNSNSSGDSGINGNTYTSSFGFSLTFDDSTLSAELLTDGNSDGGVVLSATGAYVTIVPTSYVDASSCLSDLKSNAKSLDGMSDVTTLTSGDRLTGGDEGKYETLQGTLALTNGDAPVYVYIECRPTGGEETSQPIFVAITAIIIQDAFGDLQQPLQDMLDSIEVSG